MAVDVNDWSTTSSENTTVEGINIGEGTTTPSSVNNALRSIMAGVAGLRNTVTALSSTVAGKLSAAGAVFSGAQPIYTGRGAYLHHNSSSNTSGRVYVLAEGSALPTSPANGDIVYFYAP